MKVPNRTSLPKLPPNYLVLNVEAPASTLYQCGADFVQGLAHGRKVPKEQLERWKFKCHDVAPGATVPLKISFLAEGKPLRPKGELHVTTTRGKLSPSRVTLDGKHDHITVRYTAPDETIKVSLRAFLDGYARGKAHLHLE
jgi:hypothetical protein